MRIREIREDKGISQKGLAAILGVSPTNIYNYEAGRTEPSADMLIKIARALEVSVDYLIGNSDDFGNITIISDTSTLSKDEQTVLSCFQSLDIFQREAILIQLKALAGKNKENELIKK